MTIPLTAYLLALQVVAAPGPYAECVPEGISLEERLAVPPSSKPQTSAITIGTRLRALGARCRNKTLVDGKGREVRFHRLIGCWGNPPADYLEQQVEQTKELAALKKKYTVIEIPCGLADPRKG